MKLFQNKKFIILICLTFLASEATAKPAETNITQDKPIIITTQARNYEQPTIQQYEECQGRRDQCLSVCATHAQQEKCTAECPVCPILIDQDILIQGINDTLYQTPVQTTSNTTNIIRLTNEIRNVVQSYMGNITSINENKIHVHQNISSVGGKYGFGYNNNGDCCLVEHKNSNCSSSRPSRSTNCRHKRHRLCGERCKARIMYAKKEVKCDENTDNCKETIEYSTTPPKAKHNCRYTEQYPFVECPHDKQLHQKNICSRCLQIPYGRIIYRGVPRQCMHCKGMFAPPSPMHFPFNSINPYSPFMNMYPPPSYPFFYPPSNVPGDNYYGESMTPEFESGDDWKIEKKKCQNEDGTIYDCDDEDDHSLDQNDDFDLDLNDDDLEEPFKNDFEEDKVEDENDTSRFRRSSYSKRYPKH